MAIRSTLLMRGGSEDVGWDRCCLQKSRKSFCHLHTVTTFYTNINALNLFQSELYGYCIDNQFFQITKWYDVQTGYELGVIFGIPFLLILHNYIRIIVALLRSLRQNAQLIEGPAQ